ncbi:EamA family transporter [Halobacteriales archaeon QS_4_66_20]|nr:MAG: EamA family transporter [Halobacteriales archaeon QS_4_66_20]
MSSYRNGGLFLLLSILWGTAFMAIKAGLAYIPPVLFAGFRYDIAGVIMLGYAAYATDNWRPRSRADWATVAVGAVLIIALYNAFLFIGQQGVTSGVAAILVALNPILATGFSRLFLPEERLRSIGVVGLLLGIIGVGIVVRPNPTNLLTSDFVASGFVLLAAVCIALGSVLVQRTDSTISTEGMVAWSNALGAVILHLISAGLPSESVSSVTISIEALSAILYLAVFASAIGYFIYFDLLDRLGAIEINLVSYAAPVFAAVSGWLVLDETLDLLSIVGFFGIFGGFILLKRDAIREELSIPEWVGLEKYSER